MEDKHKADLADRLRLEGIYCRGYGVIPKAVMLMPPDVLPIGSKAVYAFLCAMAGSGNTTFPTRDYIQDCLQIGKDTYYRYQKPLIEHGFITVERQRGEHACWTHNEFTLPEVPAGLPVEDGTEDTESWLYSRLITEGVKVKGYGLIAKAMMEDKRLDIKAKALMAYIVSYAGAGKVAFPKVPTMCAHLGVSKSTYQKMMREIVSLGYLEVKQRNNASGKSGFGVNDYYILYSPTEHDKDAPWTKNADMVKPDIVNADTAKADTVKPDTADTDTENRDTIINIPSTNNSSLVNNIRSSTINPSINSAAQIDAMDGKSEREQFNFSVEIYRSMIEDSLDYRNIPITYRHADMNLTDAAITLMARTCAGTGPIKIGGDMVSREEVRKVFLSLTYEHLDYVFTCMNEQAEKGNRIYNFKAYMLASLYNAPVTIDAYYSNKVRVDNI